MRTYAEIEQWLADRGVVRPAGPNGGQPYQSNGLLGISDLGVDDVKREG